MLKGFSSLTLKESPVQYEITGVMHSSLCECKKQSLKWLMLGFCADIKEIMVPLVLFKCFSEVIWSYRNELQLKKLYLRKLKACCFQNKIEGEGTCWVIKIAQAPHHLCSGLQVCNTSFAWTTFIFNHLFIDRNLVVIGLDFVLLSELP